MKAALNALYALAQLFAAVFVFFTDRQKRATGAAEERSRTLEEQQQRVEAARAARRDVSDGMPGNDPDCRD